MGGRAEAKGTSYRCRMLGGDNCLGKQTKHERGIGGTSTI